MDYENLDNFNSGNNASDQSFNYGINSFNSNLEMEHLPSNKGEKKNKNENIEEEIPNEIVVDKVLLSSNEKEKEFSSKIKPIEINEKTNDFARDKISYKDPVSHRATIQINQNQEMEKEINSNDIDKINSNQLLNSKIISQNPIQSQIALNKNSLIYKPPVISSVMNLDIGNLAGKGTNLTQEERQQYETVINEMKKENEELRKEYEEQLKNEINRVTALKNQHKKDMEDMRTNYEEKLKQNESDFNEREKIMKVEIQDLKNEVSDQIKKEEQNIKEINQQKLELKKKEYENKIDLIKKTNNLLLEKKKAELEIENRKTEKKVKPTNHKQLEELVSLLGNENNIKDKIELILKENEDLNEYIKEKEKEIEVVKEVLLNKKKEYDQEQIIKQKRVLALNEELKKEQKRVGELERELRREELRNKEELDKKELQIKYKQKEYDLSLEILKNKFENKKNEIFRERQKLNESKKYFEQYKNNELRNIENKENELVNREKICRDKELLISEKMNSFNEKNYYISSSNENNNKEKEDLILERRELEKDKEDVRIALKRNR